MFKQNVQNFDINHSLKIDTGEKTVGSSLLKLIICLSLKAPWNLEKTEKFERQNLCLTMNQIDTNIHFLQKQIY